MEAAQQDGSHASSLIQRDVYANTTCFAFFTSPETTPPPTTTTPPITTASIGKPASSSSSFELRLTCHVNKYISAGHGRRLELAYRGRAATASCAVVAAAAGVPDDDKDAVRDALRGLLRTIRPLQDLGLTDDDEWESLVPEDVVPQLADPAARAHHAGAAVHLAVVCRVRYDAATVLMTGCRKCEEKEQVGGDGDGDGVVVDAEAAECSVCIDALRRSGEEAGGGGGGVELPGCGHTFHRRCISRWFRRKPTCPLCRGDVAKYLDPELGRHMHMADFTDEAR